MDDKLSSVEYSSLLYDFYGCLLSELQSEVMELYHEDNLSLSEIAEQLGESRQAVHYTLKRAEKSLNEYEEKLGLIKAYKARQEDIAILAGLLENAGMPERTKAEFEVVLERLAEQEEN